MIRSLRIPLIAFAVALALAPLVAAAQARASRPAVPSGPAEKVTFTTDFGFNGRHSPYYTALERGFFKEMGLDVRIVRGGGSLDAIRQVAAGNAQAGFADIATLIAMRANENVRVKEISIV